MIRVGLILTFTDSSWLGGVSYFKNLLTAIGRLPVRRIEPVILTGEDTDRTLATQFPIFETVVAPELNTTGHARLIRRGLAKTLHSDVVLARVLKRHRIEVLSHQGFLASIAPTPILGWIPDFQEKHLPEFFGNAELRARARKISMFRKACKCILLSSEDARKDLASIDPHSAARARVLRFVASVSASSAATPLQELESRYNFRGKFFLLPNQFWAHKNHSLVIDALALLRDKRPDLLVFTTGNPSDHRQPDHYQILLRKAEMAGVSSRFRNLGMVSQEDLVGLMRACVAIINPSLFEGWSTTVEESKSLGKTILLSNLAVHREQNPARGIYFDPRSPVELADRMSMVWDAIDPIDEQQSAEAAARELPHRQHEFARRYEDILLELAASP